MKRVLLTLTLMTATLVLSAEASAQCDASWVNQFKESLRAARDAKTPLAEQVSVNDAMAMSAFAKGQTPPGVDFNQLKQKVTSVSSSAKKLNTLYTQKISPLEKQPDVVLFNKIEDDFDRLYETDIKRMESGDRGRLFDDYREKAHDNPQDIKQALLTIELNVLIRQTKSAYEKRQKFLALKFPHAAKLLPLQAQKEAAEKVKESLEAWASCAKPVATAPVNQVAQAQIHVPTQLNVPPSAAQMPRHPASPLPPTR